MDNRHKKRCLISLTVRETQIRMAIIKESTMETTYMSPDR